MQALIAIATLVMIGCLEIRFNSVSNMLTGGADLGFVRSTTFTCTWYKLSQKCDTTAISNEGMTCMRGSLLYGTRLYLFPLHCGKLTYN